MEMNYQINAYDVVDDMMKVKSMQKKWRESWPGSAIDTAKWDVAVGTGMTAGVTGGLLQITTGVDINNVTTIVSKETFTVPFKMTFGLGLSQRIANQTFIVEAVSINESTGLIDESCKIGFVFDGTSATTAKTRVRNNSSTGDIDTSGTYPTTVGAVSYYEIEPYADEAWFHGGTLDSSSGRANSNRKHKDIPDPNRIYKIRIRIMNGATAPATTTTVTMPYICCSDYAELTAEITAGRGQNVAGQAIGVQVVGTANSLVTGSAAHDAAVSGNPVRLGGRALSANYTTVSTGDTADLVTTLQGILVVKMNQIPELTWAYQGIIATAATTAAKIAGAAGIRNYVTDVQLQNTGATPTVVQIADGASVLWQLSLPASMTLPIVVNFQTHLKGTAATALNVITSAAGNVFTNIQGYQAS